MKRQISQLAVAGFVVAGAIQLPLHTGTVLAGFGQSLSVNQARESIAKLSGLGDLDEKQVRIKSVDQGITGKDAVVVAQVETAFKMTRIGGRWEVSEVRVGPGQWESVELVREAISKEKERRTAADLRALKSAADAFCQETASEPKARTMSELDDLLSPRYIGKVIRFDYWGRPLKVEESAQGLKVISAGIDGRYGTKDDIWLMLTTSANAGR